MPPGGSRSSWWSRRRLAAFAWLGPCLCLLIGCAGHRPQMDRALMSEKGSTHRNKDVAEHYGVYCPDVLMLEVAGRPSLSGKKPLGPDGRIDLGEMGRLRVEGRSVPEIRQLVAEAAGVDPDSVQVRVAAFKSQQIYLFGQVKGLQRAVPYKGQETLLDLLQRAGGITPGAAPNNVYIVRPHVVDGREPEVFHIDLCGILLDHNQKTNLRVQPFDEVYVGETRKSCVEKCISPLLRPLYKAVCCLGRRQPQSGVRGQASGARGQGSGVRGQGSEILFPNHKSLIPNP